LSTKVAVEATAQSVEHWERMIGWAREQDPDGYPDHTRMEQEIGEDWFSESCPLCQHFLHSDYLCDGCPLQAVFGYCSDLSALNAWQDVRYSRTWGEWLEAAEVMLLQLKVALKLLKEASNA